MASAKILNQIKVTMDFNHLVAYNLLPLLKGHGFAVVEQRENYFRFKSISVEVSISYNKLDRTCLFEIGKIDQFLYPLNDEVIEKVFGSNIKIDKVTKEQFVDNIAFFLGAEGSDLLKGYKRKLFELKDFIERESKEYTNGILQEQILALADKAWEHGDYNDFIKIVDQIEKERLPSSYQLKYIIANKKI